MPIVDSATLFGRCLATIRRDLGITQEQFARRIGITRTGLAQVETGRATLSLHGILRIGQKIADDRVDQDATVLFRLLYLSARELQRQGIRVLNRPLRPGDDLLLTERIDRAVGIIFQREFREKYVLVDVVDFDDDEDEP